MPCRGRSFSQTQPVGVNERLPSKGAWVLVPIKGSSVLSMPWDCVGVYPGTPSKELGDVEKV